LRRYGTACLTELRLLVAQGFDRVHAGGAACGDVAGQRWDERAGSSAGCDKLPMGNALEVQKRRPALKKRSTNQSPKRQEVRKQDRVTIGLDLGDKKSRYCVLNGNGDVVETGNVETMKAKMAERFGRMRRCRMAMEVGTHSPWLSRLLTSLGHEVIVANARQVQLISASSRKDDRVDAETLARLARVDPQLLRPIRHRSEEAQKHLAVIRVRATLVETRTMLINSARGLAKAMGERLPQCDAAAMDLEKGETLPAEVKQTLAPLLEQVGSVTEKIQQLDEEIEQIARSEYPETELLKQIRGVGTMIALTFVLTVEDRERFAKSRDVGCYVGLRPKRSESGEREPQLGISKEGDIYLRKLLVQGAQCILSRRGEDSDLKRWGLKLAGRGGKNAKKRAIVAVARKLAILLHRLWVTAEVYEPLRNSRAVAGGKAA
jgi:transposase